MAKVKVQIGYNCYVMDEGPAFALFRAMNGTTIERFDTTYDSDTKTARHKVTPQESGFITLHSVSDDDYAIWKLAGVSE